jgi:hypothetical protein
VVAAAVAAVAASAPAARSDPRRDIVPTARSGATMC